MDLTELQKKLEALKQKLATKQGELNKLQQDEEAAFEKLKSFGVNSLEEAEAKSEELHRKCTTAAEECATLLQECEDILSGKLAAETVGDASDDGGEEEL